LLPGVPRRWLENGKAISLRDVSGYFGQFNFELTSFVKEGYIEASFDCDPGREPRVIRIRVAHPQELRAKKVTGGIYNPQSETVTVILHDGKADVKLLF
jgi:hypothetical protein